MDKVLFVCSILAMSRLSCSLPVNQEEEVSGTCEAFTYCGGVSFPERVKVLDRAISCAEGITEDYILENCCLPQEYHLVCYDIKIEGETLNYSNDTEDFLSMTDFSELCRHMVATEDYLPGEYNSVSLSPGGGDIAFLYGEWKDVQQSNYHINHLACGTRP